MSKRNSRFGALAQAVLESTAQLAPVAEAAEPTPHRPSLALGLASESLKERIARLEADLAAAGSANQALEKELTQARSVAGTAGDSADEFLFLDPGLVNDTLPRDRLPGAFDGPEFLALLEDIRANGQNDAITVRHNGQGYEIAAGRRRLEACRRLGISVLARRRDLDEAAMLRVQFSENERREDISALERARWFAEVRTRMKLQGRDLAAQFGLDPSTFSLYLRLSRFPPEITERLRAPRRLAMLRARRVMEAIDADAGMLPRILAALDRQAQAAGPEEGGVDPDEQIALLMRVAEGRGVPSPGQSGNPKRRHVVHQGQRIGTLTRNGGQWVFRFATSLPDGTVQRLADRLPSLLQDD
ncbi:ParB/RepB/Spo0J family partition protein [Pseudoroseomonas oryzae]|uniref:ParB/RepB/Spo0J family partition protein n=1 Tax=Teichococcus oryzae TaxID=1608942 RepID=A0A5B2TDD4_9PROT|nr:ParB/RepB/Spo0J family partition protein [Pseudoroseomonas oryzae]